MWLDGGDLAIGLGRALMRGRNAAMPTILNPSHRNASLGCIRAALHGFWNALAIWTVSGDAFLVEEADRKANFPLQLESLAAPIPWKSHAVPRLCMMVIFVHYRRHGAVSCRLRSKGNFSGLIV
jgi:hypothetical protein